MSARILRTRSGRELRRLEPVPKKLKTLANNKVSVVKNEEKKDQNKIVENNIKLNSTPDIKEEVSNAKRKRGRPRNPDSANNKVPKTDLVDNVKKKKVEKVQENNQQEDKAEPSRRKPRIASLNAMAKVNAVLDNYRPQSKKDILAVIQEIDKKCDEENQKLQFEQILEEKIEEDVFEEIQEDKKKEEVASEKNDKNDKNGEEKTVQSDDVHEQIKLAIMEDKEIQTEVIHKSVQTDMTNFPSNNTTLCTCQKKRNGDMLSYYSPQLSYKEYLRDPIHIKSSVLARTKTHSIAVPVLKRHILWNKSNDFLEHVDMTSNITCLVDSCIGNTLMKNTLPCSKLMYLASYKEKSIEDQELDDFKNVSHKKNSKKQTGLLVPSLNYAPISVPNSTYHGGKSQRDSSMSGNVYKKQKLKPSEKSKKCNGWQFEGEPIEVISKPGSGVRKLYQGVSRNNNNIQLHDAVILKSGLGKTDADFVARIASFWEDSEGQHAGEMMMSVLWYYKPEQTSSKLNEMKGEQREVFASRHKDDNSVACIIDKCYVVSFPQYCRFRAQQLICHEKRRRKQIVVTETKNNRSRFIPSPDVGLPIVYFCRYGYDYRSGKTVKNY